LKAKVNGTEIFFDVVGAGLRATPKAMVEKPVCVVLHGGPAGDHSSFRPWLDTISDDLQLIYVDHRGTGRSDRKVPFETCTTENIADDVDELRRMLGIDKWNVMGCSYGGTWALTYALRHQEHISHLVIIDSLASWKECWPEAQKNAERMGTPAQRRVFRDVYLAKLNTDEEHLKWYNIMFPLFWYQEKPGKYNKEVVRQWIARNNGNGALGAWMWTNVMPNYDITDKLSRIHVPTLVVAGKYDWVTPPSQAIRIANGIPGARLVIFQKSGHFPYIEEKPKFDRLLFNFLGIKPTK